ncbi:MAG: hypothetical protein J5742_01490 [Alphaproteobacteria bacterium]|nr:hypothetical protein [Alphaproteobacteria bacterium]
MSTQERFFSCFLGVLAILSLGFGAHGASPTNPRASDSDTAPRQIENENIVRRAMVGTTRIRSGQTRTGTAVVGRGAMINSAARLASPATRVRVRTATVPADTSRVARSAKPNARSGKNSVLSTSNISRSAVVRATALFNDVSKIGSGYAGCRESYATCMDQICGQANDTYRRCFCSDRFTQFRKTEDALDKAVLLLQQFQDNNLNAVDKTAAEVNAMYSATVGEQAIKKDTSASAKLLNEINDLLSGKSSSVTTSKSTSLGVLDLDFSTDMGDIWSGDGGGSLFSSSGQDLSGLEGAALFNAAQKQCSRLTQSMCENDAVFSMSKSSYNILISQDCNAYEKSLSKKRESVAQSVRTAEKYLREARLEEYRSHNSQDVNECIAKVRSAVLADTACGENYKRCLDPTGAYINGATGEAIYSPRLFKLEQTIDISGDISGDVLKDNKDYDKFLDVYRKYVTRELDTCRDIADFVWTEFKRNAIIEIAQAQTNKIEEVKMSCVSTMAECYDTQTQALIDFDKNTATAAGALGRYTARDMCREKVIACAALYGNNDGNKCSFDQRGHLVGDNATCGLQGLINYVSTVDSLNVVEKCNAAIDEYVEKLCTPDDGKYEYPYKCKGMSPVYQKDNNMSLPYVIQQYAAANCSDISTNPDKKYDLLDAQIKTRIDSAVADINNGVRMALREVCEEMEGHWYSSDANGTPPNDSTIGANRLGAFYNAVSGRGVQDSTLEKWGVCYENSRMLACLAYNSNEGADGEVTTTNVATWDSTREQCTFTESWYENKCQELGGYYANSNCYIGD